MPVRTSGGVFDQQVLTGSLSHWVVCGADFSGAFNSYGQPVPGSAAEIIFTKISEGAYINIMNPNESNLSFALEEGRSIWDEISLTQMIQGLGSDVGVDHIDCSVCIVKRVPYVWGCGASGPLSFLELTDTPDTYSGAANYVVTVNPTETGLIFTPVGITSNAFSYVAVPSQPTISAVGSDTLTIVPGSNVIITTNALSKSVTISSTAGIDYTPIAPGATAGTATPLSASVKYFITGTGYVRLPSTVGLTPGRSVHIAKPAGNSPPLYPTITVYVLVDNAGTELIKTDLGNDTTIEFDATQHIILVYSGSGNWQLQIGSAF